jgi:hypothetical protein
MFDLCVLERPFLKMGARVKVETFNPSPNVRNAGALRLDVAEDNKGEFFSLRFNRRAALDIRVLDVRPADRHLLLFSKEAQDKSRYLLGHDERHWFVAAIPESSPVSTVEAAKQALKPEAVLAAERGLSSKYRHRRRNDAWLRQGEWFFLPAEPKLNPGVLAVFRNEPIMRGGGKPHMCEELVRAGGIMVYVSRRYPQGLTQADFNKLEEGVRRTNTWRVMKRDMDVYVRGRVRHPDHATLQLDGWHRVLSNTELRARAMQQVVFLD